MSALYFVLKIVLIWFLQYSIETNAATARMKLGLVRMK